MFQPDGIYIEWVSYLIGWEVSVLNYVWLITSRHASNFRSRQRFQRPEFNQMKKLIAGWLKATTNRTALPRPMERVLEWVTTLWSSLPIWNICAPSLSRIPLMESHLSSLSARTGLRPTYCISWQAVTPTLSPTSRSTLHWTEALKNATWLWLSIHEKTYWRSPLECWTSTKISFR